MSGRTGVAFIKLPRHRTYFERTGPCRKATSTMYPTRAAENAAALAICAGCSVRKECLQHALDNDERFGVWGGTTERQRRLMARAAS